MLEENKRTRKKVRKEEEKETLEREGRRKKSWKSK